MVGDIKSQKFNYNYFFYIDYRYKYKENILYIPKNQADLSFIYKNI